jgi:hypothetical protein
MMAKAKVKAVRKRTLRIRGLTFRFRGLGMYSIREAIFSSDENLIGDYIIYKYDANKIFRKVSICRSELEGYLTPEETVKVESFFARGP